MDKSPVRLWLGPFSLCSQYRLTRRKFLYQAGEHAPILQDAHGNVEFFRVISDYTINGASLTPGSMMMPMNGPQGSPLQVKDIYDSTETYKPALYEFLVVLEDGSIQFIGRGSSSPLKLRSAKEDSALNLLLEHLTVALSSTDKQLLFSFNGNSKCAALIKMNPQLHDFFRPFK